MLTNKRDQRLPLIQSHIIYGEDKIPFSQTSLVSGLSRNDPTYDGGYPGAHGRDSDLFQDLSIFPQTRQPFTVENPQLWVTIPVLDLDRKILALCGFP